MTLGAATAVTCFSGGGVSTPFTTSLSGDNVLVGFNVTDVDYLFAGTRIHIGVQGIGKSLAEVAASSANNTNTTMLPGLNGLGCFSSNYATTTQFAPDGNVIVGMEVNPAGYSSGVRFNYAPLSYVAGLNNGSSDNCGIATITASQTQFTCADAGLNTVTLTVTDLSGNSSSTTATVDVQDLISPTITCPGTANLSADAGMCSSSASIGAATAADNCAGVVVFGPVPASPYAIGTTTVTWTATDVAGNQATCTQDVVVTDDELPAIACPATANLRTDAGLCSSSATIGVATATDNCAGVIVLLPVPNRPVCRWHNNRYVDSNRCSRKHFYMHPRCCCNR